MFFFSSPHFRISLSFGSFILRLKVILVVHWIACCLESIERVQCSWRRYWIIFSLKNIEHAFFLPWIVSGSWIFFSSSFYLSISRFLFVHFLYAFDEREEELQFSRLFAIYLAIRNSMSSFIAKLLTPIDDFITSIEYFIGFNRKAINVCSFLTLLVLLLLASSFFFLFAYSSIDSFYSIFQHWISNALRIVYANGWYTLAQKTCYWILCYL